VFVIFFNEGESLMARLVGVMQTSHTPFLYWRPERWHVSHVPRPRRADVPADDSASSARKHARVQESFAVLRRKLAEAHPDVIVIFGDDHLECFDFSNNPAFSIFVGDEFEGAVTTEDAPAAGASRPCLRLRGHPPLGTALLTGLMKRGIDPAFCMDMPNPSKGIGHSIMRPAQSLTDLRTPIVPFLINCYFAPQPTARRCLQVGRAVREVIDELPGDLRVAIIGSGGLWHTPHKPEAWVNEEFDEVLLGHMIRGDIAAMAAHFDDYRIPAEDVSQAIGERNRTVTGMPALGGPQGGTREICAWIAAAAVADGAPATVVDRVPIYASPVDTAFAYFNL
jgi:aromatic ring-opening dioxygenase catalytic subunit (LigB family)